MPNGILLLNKPEGVRSTACVSRAKRILKEKVGHAGTLDSTARGLLVILVGAATKLSDAVMKLPKLYRAVIKLGSETDTADASGKVIFSGDISSVCDKNIDSVLLRFQGKIMQSPPEISAIKVGGKPAHKIARSGNAEGFSLPPRPVEVYSIKRISSFQDSKFEIEVHCGKGVYIRSIARDIGRALGCGGHVVGLERLSVGKFTLSQAVSLDDISEKAVRECLGGEFLL